MLIYQLGTSKMYGVSKDKCHPHINESDLHIKYTLHNIDAPRYPPPWVFFFFQNTFVIIGLSIWTIRKSLLYEKGEILRLSMLLQCQGIIFPAEPEPARPSSVPCRSGSEVGSLEYMKQLTHFARLPTWYILNVLNSKNIGIPPYNWKLFTF